MLLTEILGIYFFFFFFTFINYVRRGGIRAICWAAGIKQVFSMSQH